MSEIDDLKDEVGRLIEQLRSANRLIEEISVVFVDHDWFNRAIHWQQQTASIYPWDER